MQQRTACAWPSHCSPRRGAEARRCGRPTRRRRRRSARAARRPRSTTRASSAPTPTGATGSPTAAPTTSSASARSRRSTRATSAQLGLAWCARHGTTRGLEATPLVVDGVMYTTGELEHRVRRRRAQRAASSGATTRRCRARCGRSACCDVVNRGVALYEGRVFVGTLDGRLVALDAATGAVVWEVTTVDRSKPYTITGAPRVVKGKVIIGNGGAEFGVRGYVSAYDADDRRARLALLHRARRSRRSRFESPALERAADDLDRRVVEDRRRRHGLGLARLRPRARPALRRHRQRLALEPPARSPGGGDNLYLCSILALRPDTGELVWHYQTTPGDSWDFTATQHMILADLEIDGAHAQGADAGAEERLLLRARPRDRRADLGRDVRRRSTWATGVDLATRPARSRPRRRATRAAR